MVARGPDSGKLANSSVVAPEVLPRYQESFQLPVALPEPMFRIVQLTFIDVPATPDDGVLALETVRSGGAVPESASESEPTATPPILSLTWNGIVNVAEIEFDGGVPERTPFDERLSQTGRGYPLVVDASGIDHVRPLAAGSPPLACSGTLYEVPAVAPTREVVVILRGATIDSPSALALQAWWPTLSVTQNRSWL